MKKRKPKVLSLKLNILIKRPKQKRKQPKRSCLGSEHKRFSQKLWSKTLKIIKKKSNNLKLLYARKSKHNPDNCLDRRLRPYVPIRQMLYISHTATYKRLHDIEINDSELNRQEFLFQHLKRRMRPPQLLAEQMDPEGHSLLDHESGTNSSSKLALLGKTVCLLKAPEGCDPHLVLIHSAGRSLKALYPPRHKSCLICRNYISMVL